jgi:hypothetical protein
VENRKGLAIKRGHVADLVPKPKASGRSLCSEVVKKTMQKDKLTGPKRLVDRNGRVSVRKAQGDKPGEGS